MHLAQKVTSTTELEIRFLPLIQEIAGTSGLQIQCIYLSQEVALMYGVHMHLKKWLAQVALKTL